MSPLLATARALLTGAQQDLDHWQSVEPSNAADLVAEGVRLRTALGAAMVDLAVAERAHRADPWAEECGAAEPDLEPMVCQRPAGHDGPHDVFPFPRVSATEEPTDALGRPTIEQVDAVLQGLGVQIHPWQRDHLAAWLETGSLPVAPF